MHKRRLLNLPEDRQAELRRQYPWLKAVAEDEKGRTDVKVMSVTVFDHWLSRDDTNRLLEDVPPEEQASRTAKHANFCGLLVAGTPVLSFALRGRSHDRTIFRRFTSPQALSKYCTPDGGRTLRNHNSLRHHHFRVVLPELNCAYFESWDDTHQLYYTDSIVIRPLQEWAAQAGLYILEHG